MGWMEGSERGRAKGQHTACHSVRCIQDSGNHLISPPTSIFCSSPHYHLPGSGLITICLHRCTSFFNLPISRLAFSKWSFTSETRVIFLKGVLFYSSAKYLSTTPHCPQDEVQDPQPGTCEAFPDLAPIIFCSCLTLLPTPVRTWLQT